MWEHEEGRDVDGEEGDEGDAERERGEKQDGELARSDPGRGTTGRVAVTSVREHPSSYGYSRID